jgi:hypothetical protein
MCGGGVGSANDPSNDDEKDSGNSFKETLANIFTPGDGMSYVDGQLTEDSDSRDKKFYDYSAGNNVEMLTMRINRSTLLLFLVPLPVGFPVLLAG